MASRKLFIKSYGCQMNVYDAGRMTDVLTPLGYDVVSRPEGADLVILNTCHIREKASEKVYSDLGRLRPLKAARAQEGGRMVVAVAGCVAQAEGEALMARMPLVDVVVGPQAYHRLPEMLARVERAAGRAIDTSFPPEPKFDALPEPTADGPCAFLSVQEGCDKFCSYCVVPYTRGQEYSRPVAAVLREARALVESGAREITLLGQNVNAYHGEGPDGRAWTLARLVDALAEVQGLERLRYTTSHPRDVGTDLIQAHRDNPVLMPFVHLPVQSGSNRVLAAMNRGHDRDHYLRLVDQFRSARPGIAIASDFIVGHPGETEADLEQTLALIDAVGFVHSYAFKFSPRPGTPAALLPGALDEAEKSARLARVQERLAVHQGAALQALVGTTVPVLFDRPGRHPGQTIGRTPAMQPVHVSDPAVTIGSLSMVRITGAGPLSVSGERLEAAPLARSCA